MLPGQILTWRKVNLGRRTTVAHSRLRMKELQLAAARERQHGLQIMTFEQLAARLAGGLVQPVNDDALREAISTALPQADLGELEGIKALPGMTGAAADTLRKAWRASLDLQARAGEHPRLRSIANLENAVVAALPPSMMRPADLVAAGLARLDHAAALFGPIEIVGITELSPVWRPLLHAIARRVPVRWNAGPPPGAPTGSMARPSRSCATSRNHRTFPAVSAATAYHEAVEAMRWARELLASGRAEPADIAIASATPGEYDDHLLALRADANLDLHFVHGVTVTASREGQAAAALADIPAARPLPDADATAEHTAKGPCRSVRGPAGGLDAHPAGRCATFVSRGLDAPDRRSGRHRLAGRSRSRSGARRHRRPAVPGCRGRR